MIALPWTGDQFGCFAVVELDENGEPVIDQGQSLELYPGDLILQQQHGFNLPIAEGGAGEH